MFGETGAKFYHLEAFEQQLVTSENTRDKHFRNFEPDLVFRKKRHVDAPISKQTIRKGCIRKKLSISFQQL